MPKSTNTNNDDTNKTGSSRKVYKISRTLHNACRYPMAHNKPLEIIQHYPDQVKETNKNNEFPLHLACFNGCLIDVIIELIYLYPEALKHPNRAGFYPLQVLLIRYPEFCYDIGRYSDIITLMIEKDPICLQQTNSHGDFALHVSCYPDLIQRDDSIYMKLIKMYPEAAAQQN
jgi:hypothetical protein